MYEPVRGALLPRAEGHVPRRPQSMTSAALLRARPLPPPGPRSAVSWTLMVGFLDHVVVLPLPVLRSSGRSHCVVAHSAVFVLHPCLLLCTLQDRNK